MRYKHRIKAVDFNKHSINGIELPNDMTGCILNACLHYPAQTWPARDGYLF